MPRTDIWQDGINTRFSRENQPANRGRKKLSAIFRQGLVALWNRTIEAVEQQRQADEVVEQQQRDRRNAKRRERYALNKKGPGEPPTRPTEPQEPPLRL